MTTTIIISTPPWERIRTQKSITGKFSSTSAESLVQHLDGKLLENSTNFEGEIENPSPSPTELLFDSMLFFYDGHGFGFYFWDKCKSHPLNSWSRMGADSYIKTMNFLLLFWNWWLTMAKECRGWFFFIFFFLCWCKLILFVFWANDPNLNKN